MAAQTWLAPFTKLMKSMKDRGAKGTLLQLYTIGDLKAGELRGTDSHGNKYYENPELPYGQHRWVEYADIHNPDPTMIPPEWHGWMHHTFDETPEEFKDFNGLFGQTSQVSHAPYQTHLAMITSTKAKEFPSTNLTQFRLRGYKTGSLFIGPNDKEQYWKQPGHPLYDGPKQDHEEAEHDQQELEWNPIVVEKIDNHPNNLADVQRLPGNPENLKMSPQVDYKRPFQPEKVLRKGPNVVVPMEASAKIHREHSPPTQVLTEAEEREQHKWKLLEKEIDRISRETGKEHFSDQELTQMAEKYGIQIQAEERKQLK